MSRSFSLLSALTFCLLLPLSPAQAVLIPYQFTLHVEKVIDYTPEFGVFSCATTTNVSCQPVTGSFEVDDAILSREGTNLMGTIANFYIQVGASVFDQNKPLISAFEGFRGPGSPADENTLHFVLYASAPGFNVHNGVLTSLFGGVIGSGDGLFIDFALLSGIPQERFAAQFYRTALHPFGFDDLTATIGMVSISPIPEPSTLLLLGSVVAFLVIGARYGLPR